MRGLKHLCPPSGYHHYVASFTDAWIETFLILILSIILWSHLLQMRGLKPNLDFETTPSPESHLLQMRGLKLTRRLLKVVLMCRIFYRCVDWNRSGRCTANLYPSHLLQMRGLKHVIEIFGRWESKSHLLQMRGLKLNRDSCFQIHNLSHLLQMRGLKRNIAPRMIKMIWSHLLQMRGLKHIFHFAHLVTG